MDYSLELRKEKLGYRIDFFLKNLLPMVAFGLPVGFLLTIPVVNLFMIPIAVSGATLLFAKLHVPTNNNV